MYHEDEELEGLLRENTRLVRENNKLLHKLWRAEVTGFWTKVLFYVLLIGVPVVIYQYYFEGYVEQMRKTYDSLRDAAEELQNIPPLNTLPAAVVGQFQKRDDAVE